jgi:thiamine biosynthesis lipoprotein
MSHWQKTEVRRMRPFLGTFVEVRVRGLVERDATTAIDRAFAQVATVEERMSAHDPRSDLGRLFQGDGNEPVTVHPWTFQVIEAAQRLHRLSGGVFDISVGDILEREGLLPAWRKRRQIGIRGAMAGIELSDGNRIRVYFPIRLDLGGIAKGFAVDRAVDALMDSGIPAGCVNAGGDFRIFGDIRTGAVATSGGYFREQPRRRSAPVTSFVDGRTRKTLRMRKSITVIASSCMWADALTKVLAIDLRTGAALLNDFGAQALLISETQAVLDFRVLPSPAEIQVTNQWNEGYDRYNDSRE